MPQTDSEGFTEAYQQTIMQDKEREADKRLMVSFRKHPVLDEDATAKAGRPVHKELDYIKIMTPGDKLSVVDRAWGWPSDERRFGHLYRAWVERNREGDGLVGTPLEAWPVVSKAQIEDLKYFNVRTVEGLSNIPDALCGQIGPILDLRQKARDFLVAAEKGSAATALRAEIEEQKTVNASLQETLRRMQEQIDTLTAPPKPVAAPRR